MGRSDIRRHIVEIYYMRVPLKITFRDKRRPLPKLER
jgi:hypothetical protein